jgi:hypothetical protein
LVSKKEVADVALDAADRVPVVGNEPLFVLLTEPPVDDREPLDDEPLEGFDVVVVDIVDDDVDGCVDEDVVEGFVAAVVVVVVVVVVILVVDVVGGVGGAGVSVGCCPLA